MFYSDFPGFLPESLHPILTQMVASMDIKYPVVPGSTPEPPESIPTPSTEPLDREAVPAAPVPPPPEKVTVGTTV